MFGLSPFDFVAPQQAYYYPRSYPRTVYADQCLDEYDDLSNYYSRMELNELARRRQLERERPAYLERHRRDQLERQAQIERARLAQLEREREARCLAYLERERQQHEYAQRLAYARAMEERRRLAEEEEMERQEMLYRLQQQRKPLNARDMLKQQLANAAQSRQTGPTSSPRQSTSQLSASLSFVPVRVTDGSLSVDTSASPRSRSVLIEDEPITPDQWNLDSEDVFSVDRIQPSSPSHQ